MSRKEYRANWYKENKDRVKAVHRVWHYKNKYGITPEYYEVMLKEQNYVCKICFKPEESKEHRTGKVRKLAIDHCHTTGKIRGLLCRKCNHALGLFNDDSHRLFNAIMYLEEN